MQSSKRGVSRIRQDEDRKNVFKPEPQEGSGVGYGSPAASVYAGLNGCGGPGDKSWVCVFLESLSSGLAVNQVRRVFRAPWVN